MPVEWTVVKQLYRSVGKSYHPRVLDAPGVLFRTTFPGEEDLPGYDSTNGWRNLFARGLEVIQLKGEHLSITRHQSDVTALARQINEVLDRLGADENKEDEHAR